MRTRKFLLVTKALSAAGLVAACGKESAPPPGNPKGSMPYEVDASEPVILPPPGNPKGATYDADAAIPKLVAPAPAADASAATPGSGADAGTRTVDARRLDAGKAAPLPPPGNPKGSRYDKGLITPDGPRPPKPK